MGCVICICRHHSNRRGRRRPDRSAHPHGAMGSADGASVHPGNLAGGGACQGRSQRPFLISFVSDFFGDMFGTPASKFHEARARDISRGSTRIAEISGSA